MMKLKEVLLQWFIIFLIKTLLILTKEHELILVWILRTNNKQKNYTNQFLENINVRSFHLFKINYGVPMQEIYK